MLDAPRRRGRGMSSENAADDAPGESSSASARRWGAETAVQRLVADRPIIGLTVAGLGVYLLFSLTDYAQYLSGNDLGIFDQAVRAYSHFQAPTVPVKAPGFDILGDHF